MKPIKASIAPQQLIDKNGKPSYGYFDGPVTSLAIENFQYFTDMDSPASRLAKYFHFKQFQFISLISKNFVIGVAIADIRYVGTSFCYLYDIQNNELVEETWLRPLGLGYRLTPSPMTGSASIGNMGIEINDGIWSLSINTKHIIADITLSPAKDSLPLALCNPTGYSGWTYTQKHNALDVSGQLTVNGKLEPLENALAGYDFSAGFMRRETSWRWASINGRNNTGTIGLNLAAGVNETGLNENAFWLNGQRHLLGPVHFDFQRIKNTSDNHLPWHIYSYDGRVDLTFTPKNCRQERLNLLFLKSNFCQYLGHYSGFIIDGDGKKHQLDKVLGLTEDHFARW